MPLLTINQICERIGVSKVTLWKWRRAGKFPPHTHDLTGNGQDLRWSEDVVNAWIDARRDSVSGERGRTKVLPGRQSRRWVPSNRGGDEVLQPLVAAPAVGDGEGRLEEGEGPGSSARMDGMGSTVDDEGAQEGNSTRVREQERICRLEGTPSTGSMRGGEKTVCFFPARAP